MIKAINSIWKNLLFDILAGLILIGLVVYNLFGRKGGHLEFGSSGIVAIIVWYLLCFHVFVLLALTVINIVKRTFLKAVGFAAMGTGLFFGLQYIGLFLFISVMGDMPGDRVGKYDFQHSELCKQFDTTKVKATVENLRLGVYAPELDSNLIDEIKGDTSWLPKKISKITCGCRIIDSTIIIFRLWDTQQQTFELQTVNNNGQWSYNLFSMEDF